MKGTKKTASGVKPDAVFYRVPVNKNQAFAGSAVFTAAFSILGI